MKRFVKEYIEFMGDVRWFDGDVKLNPDWDFEVIAFSATELMYRPAHSLIVKWWTHTGVEFQHYEDSRD